MEFQTLNTTDTEDTVTLFSFEDGIEERKDEDLSWVGCCSYAFYFTSAVKPVEYDIDE